MKHAAMCDLRVVPLHEEDRCLLRTPYMLAWLARLVRLRKMPGCLVLVTSPAFSFFRFLDGSGKRKGYDRTSSGREMLRTVSLYRISVCTLGCSAQLSSARLSGCSSVVTPYCAESHADRCLNQYLISGPLALLAFGVPDKTRSDLQAAAAPTAFWILSLAMVASRQFGRVISASRIRFCCIVAGSRKEKCQNSARPTGYSSSHGPFQDFAAWPAQVMPSLAAPASSGVITLKLYIYYALGW